MKTYLQHIIGFMFVLLLLTGCGAGLSGQARNQVNYFGTFGELLKNPDAHKGKVVLLGGRIIGTQVDQNSTDILVLQLDLDNRDRPMDNDQSGGRFIIHSGQFLDPALYPDKARITVVGRVTGVAQRLIGKMAYNYPVIEPLEIKKWPKAQDQSPRFRFGIGVGTTF